MKTATVADLRNHFRRIAAWIENGESVQIVKRGRPFARMVPMSPASREIPKIDFAARREQIWGDRVFSDAEVKSMDDFEHEGEEG